MTAVICKYLDLVSSFVTEEKRKKEIIQIESIIEKEVICYSIVSH